MLWCFRFLKFLYKKTFKVPPLDKFCANFIRHIFNFRTLEYSKGTNFRYTFNKDNIAFWRDLSLFILRQKFDNALICGCYHCHIA